MYVNTVHSLRFRILVITNETAEGDELHELSSPPRAATTRSTSSSSRRPSTPASATGSRTTTRLAVTPSSGSRRA